MSDGGIVFETLLDQTSIFVNPLQRVF